MHSDNRGAFFVCFACDMDSRQRCLRLLRIINVENCDSLASSLVYHPIIPLPPNGTDGRTAMNSESSGRPKRRVHRLLVLMRRRRRRRQPSHARARPTERPTDALVSKGELGNRRLRATNGLPPPNGSQNHSESIHASWT